MNTAFEDLTTEALCEYLDAEIAHLRALRRIARIERNALTQEERRRQRARLVQLADRPERAPGAASGSEE